MQTASMDKSRIWEQWAKQTGDCSLAVANRIIANGEDNDFILA